MAAEYIQTIAHPAAARHILDRAFRIALAQRTVTCVIVPHDIQNQPAVEQPPTEHGAQHSTPGCARPRVVPQAEELRRAAEVVNAGSRVALLVGRGALGAGEAVAAVAERLGAGRAAQPAPRRPRALGAAARQRHPLRGLRQRHRLWYGRDLRLHRGMLASLSGTLATKGSGIPYAVAAKFAHPDRPAIVLVGDGAMQMSGLNALLSIARFWRRWCDPCLVVLVLNNRDLNYVTWEQRAMEGDPRFAPTQDVLDFPYARYAELLGLRALRVDAPDGVGAAWDATLVADRPVVVEAVVDARVPTLPPDLKPEQREKLARALAGEPDRDALLRQLQREGYTISPLAGRPPHRDRRGPEAHGRR